MERTDLADAEIRSLRRALLAWYDPRRRALPWRRSEDPYRIWVSEVMLQQTRIAVVLPAYRRFVERFPTLPALAQASEETVLAHWSGLGYYSRARSLHRAARTLVAQGEARFPDDWHRARALPGVGPYTAAAVLSIAYGQPHAAVDGNVVRVLSRLACLPRPDAGQQPHAALAARLLDVRRPGDWNQALMELGQTVCVPRRPDCDACPLSSACRARASGAVDRFPLPKPRRAAEAVALVMVVLHARRDSFLLEKGAFRYLTHLWLPPLHDATGPVRGEVDHGEVRHAILHRSFRVRVLSRELRPAQLRAEAAGDGGRERRVFRADEITEVGRSSLLTKVFRAAGFAA